MTAVGSHIHQPPSPLSDQASLDAVARLTASGSPSKPFGVADHRAFQAADQDVSLFCPGGPQAGTAPALPAFAAADAFAALGDQRVGIAGVCVAPPQIFLALAGQDEPYEHAQWADASPAQRTHRAGERWALRLRRLVAGRSHAEAGERPGGRP